MSVVSTLAEVFTLTAQGLGNPAKLPAIQVKRAVHEACALYWTDLIQSDQNQVAKSSANIPFVDDTFIYSLGAITDMTMPDWVEIQIGPNSNDWALVSVVNRDSLSMFRDRNELACSFYGDYNHNVLNNSIEFSYVPFAPNTTYNNFRVWYDPMISVNTDDSVATGFPSEYNYLLAVEARLSLIPVLVQMDIASAKEDKTDKFILEAQLRAWDVMTRKCESDRLAWRDKWRHYKLGSRANQGGRRKRSYWGERYL